MIKFEPTTPSKETETTLTVTIQQTEDLSQRLHQRRLKPLPYQSLSQELHLSQRLHQRRLKLFKSTVGHIFCAI